VALSAWGWPLSRLPANPCYSQLAGFSRIGGAPARSGAFYRMTGQPLRKPAASQPPALSEHEGMLLALIIRQQPATAYKLLKLFENSPVSSINASKGQLYPAIRRLKDRKLVVSRKVAGDGRNTEVLETTDLGKAAVRAWVANIGADHLVLDDPLRTRLLSLDLLSKEERLEWVARAKELVKDRQLVFDEYNQTVTVPYQAFAHLSVSEMLRAKMNWLDQLLYHVAKND
jgi:DNA-binding PadR family transcriptional regulator